MEAIHQSVLERKKAFEIVQSGVESKKLFLKMVSPEKQKKYGVDFECKLSTGMMLDDVKRTIHNCMMSYSPIDPDNTKEMEFYKQVIEQLKEGLGEDKKKMANCLKLKTCWDGHSTFHTDLHFIVSKNKTFII